MRAIAKIFFIHYTVLKDRKLSILHQIGEYSDVDFLSDYEFVEDFDQAFITDEIYHCYFDESSDTKSMKSEVGGIHSKSYEARNEMSLAELSNAMKHLEAYRRIAYSDGPDDELFLIFEDDVLFKDNLLDLNNSINVDVEFDVMFCGEGAMLREESGPRMDRKEPPITNCVDSYVISRRVATALHEFIIMNKISFGMDHELLYVFKKMGLVVYWSTPITVQGSITSVFASSVDRSKRLLG